MSWWVNPYQVLICCLHGQLETEFEDEPSIYWKSCQRVGSEQLFHQTTIKFGKALLHVAG